MQSVETWLQSQLDNSNILLNNIKGQVTKRKSFSTPPYPTTKHKSKEKYEEVLSFPKTHISPHSHINESQSQVSEVGKNHFKAEDCMSQIKDPLWKRICGDLAHMMEPSFILKIWSCKLGAFHSSKKSMDLYYPTEEAALFLQQFDFVILEVLRNYFPSLKELRFQEKNHYE